jgi:hypothetical protein
MAPARKVVASREPLKVRIEPAGEVLARFLVSRSKAKFIQGPVRSGKTTTLIQSLMVNALMIQPPNEKGVRRRKTVVVRNTYKQLIDTVIPSVREAMPEDVWGPINTSGRPRRMIRRPGIEWEWLFYAADKAEDIEDFKSLEASDIWFSEYRYLPREIVMVGPERVGHFPPKSKEGCANGQVMGETNAPMEDHWSAIMSGQQPIPSGLGESDKAALVKPQGWEFFIQPPGLIEVFEGDRVVGYQQNPDAENVKNLNDPLFYANTYGGKTQDEIGTEYLNRPGRLRRGKPVWPAFRRDVHVAREPLMPLPGHPVIVGQDFGRTPASVFLQAVHGRLRVLHEFWADNMGARAYARALKQEMASAFPDPTVVFSVFGDPAGDDLEQSDEISPMLMFRAEGINVVPASSNDPTVRVGAVDEYLRRMEDGQPAFIVSPTCRALIAALDGGYQFARMAVTGERYSEKPLKDRHSHIADALQYGALGAGGGVALMTRVGPAHVRPAAALPRVARMPARGWGMIYRGGRR